MSDAVATVSSTQMEFISSTSEFTLLCGGIRSGKTHCGALWALQMVLTYPDCIGIITANSYSQLRKATLAKFFQILASFNIEYEYKEQAGVILIGESKIYAFSMEKHDMIRGVEGGWGWSDECAYYKENAFDVLIGRLSDLRGPCLWKGTTTPNGFNWLAERFVDKASESTTIIYAKTIDNEINLGAGYVNRISKQYDERRAQQELEGKFVNLNKGKVYYSFDRDKHVKKIPYDRNEVCFVGLDFNVHPLCGVFVVPRGQGFHVFDEMHLENSNTFAGAKEIKEKVPYYNARIIPDETGNRRRTSASNTDHEILRRAGLDLVKFRNPSVKDRYNNINRLFAHGLITIDPKCKFLIKDVEQLVNDNKNDMLSHSSDCLGYVGWYLNPLKKRSRQASVTYY